MNKMKAALFVAIILTCGSYAFSAGLEQEETAALSELIEITKKNLVTQENLLKQLFDFKKKKELFMEEPESKKLATQLLSSALRLEAAMGQSHCLHLISAETLTEVEFFAKMAREAKKS